MMSKVSRDIFDVDPAGALAEELVGVPVTPFLHMPDDVVEVVSFRVDANEAPASPEDPAARDTARSEHDFGLSFDQLAVGMFITGLDGRVIRSNLALSQLLGTPVAVGDLGLDWVHPDDRDELVDHRARAVEGEIDGWSLERRMLHADGHSIWVQDSTTIVRDDAERPRHFLSQCTDITDRKRAEEALIESESRVRFLADGLPVALAEIGPGGIFTTVNNELCELVGRNPIGLTLRDVLHPDDYQSLVETMATKGYRDAVNEFRIRRPDLGERWVRSHSRVHVDENGGFSSSLSTWTDITEEVDTRQASMQLGEIFESIEDLVAITDADGYLKHLNLAGRLLLDDDGQPLDGLSLGSLFTEESAKDVTDVALSTARNFGSWKGEVTLVNAAFDTPRTLSLSIASHADDDGTFAFLSAMTRDITDLKIAEEHLRQQATTDALTGLPNRTILFDRLAHALSRSARNGGRVALYFVDLDKFKTVNDTMGHEAGDELLVQVSARLRTCMRDCDTVARIGGDEFVVLAEPISRTEDARIVGERIVDSMAQPFELSAGTAHIGASIGLAMSERESTPRALVKQADLAAYQAKANGRSCMVLAGE